MVSATRAFTAFSSLTSNVTLATEFGAMASGDFLGNARPSTMSAIITRAPSAASACE